jgi:hypothetical protein
MTEHSSNFLTLVKVARDIDLAMIRGLLDEYGILYYVHNEFYSSLEPGIRIPLLNERWICVAAEELGEAREILAAYDFFPFQERPYQPSPWTKCRNLFEFIFGFWMIPGDRRTVKSLPDD